MSGDKPRELTYAEAGVDRELRRKSKEAISNLKNSYKFSRFGPILELPYSNLTPGPYGLYWDHVIEGIGTKVLVAQLADKYDTIAIDGVAMAANDVIRSGATVFTIADNIDAEKSDPKLVVDWMNGLYRAAEEVEAPIVSGEIADVAVLLRPLREGKGHHIVVSCTGFVKRKNVILGDVEQGNPIIGLRSYGIHSNGISLVRKTLFKEWGGYYSDPFVMIDGLDRELVLEVLEPTRIYCKPVRELKKRVNVKAAVHITGDAYLKFDKLVTSRGYLEFDKLAKEKIGFEFNNFKPQPIFNVIQETAKKLGRVITDEEMLKTFNMGWGFAVIVDNEEKDNALDVLEKNGCEPEQIGIVNDSGKITAKYNGMKILLEDLYG